MRMQKLMIRKLCSATAIAVALLSCVGAYASSFHGRVVYAGRALPGVQVTARSGDKTESVISDSSGAFQFPDLADGKWTIEATMQCFEILQTDVDVSVEAATLQLEMKLLSPEKLVELALGSSSSTSNTLEQHGLVATASKAIAADAAQDASTQSKAPGPSKEKDKDAAHSEQPHVAQPHEENEQGADGFLVQGSVNNAVSTCVRKPVRGGVDGVPATLSRGHLYA
jgi:trimeric autotransporter adhesin